MVEKIVEKTLEELNKSQKEAYPLYYKNIFNQIAEEDGLKLDNRLTLKEGINETLLNATKETTTYIIDQNEKLKEDSKNLVENVEIINTHEDTIKVVREFEERLIDKLQNYQKKINSLNVELEKAYKELHIDTLTKAYNRKALEEELEKIMKIGKEKKLDFYIMVIDLDHFKDINDTYGHLVGDFVLIKFVQLIKEVVRDTDKLYRYGGDEFVILFNRIQKQHVTIIANKILNKIASKKLKYKDHLISLTTSIGVTCHQIGDTKEAIFKRADEALYESKKTRNRVTIQC